MSQSKLVPPHGGQLVDRTGAKENASGVAAEITLTPHQQCDLEMIAIGAMSPLEGFMGEADYHSVCDNLALSNGVAWPIPITCAVDDATAAKVNAGDRVVLKDDAGRLLGYMNVTEKYKQDKAQQAAKVFLTADVAHPGVKVVMEDGDTCLAGPIEAVTTRHDPTPCSHGSPHKLTDRRP